ncbi:MAG: hypothetical protein GY795_08815 [Desulfobacterales bacterium]|nr:hypothetical protein [Desulfobacterales bacterium]
MIITEQNFNQVIRFIENDTGIRLPDANYSLIKRFLSERLSTLETDLSSYLDLIRDNETEYDRFIDAVTINETYFFREEKHFKIIDSMIFPQYKTSKPGHLTFWSAACSTGEEAVSIAALAEKYWGKNSESTYSIFASDLNPYALKDFETGEFGENSFRKDGSCFHPILEPFIHTNGTFRFLKDSLKQKIRIHRINLLHDDLSSFSACFDIIFLRNILVYMPFDIRRKILDKIVATMADHGYLFLSSSEMPLISQANLKLMEHNGVYFFQKKNIQDKQSLLGPELPDKIKFTENHGVEFFPPEKREKHLVNVEEVLIFANQKLDNKLFSVKNNTDYSLSLRFLEIVFLINSDKLSKARDQLKIINNVVMPNEISFYLSGYLEMAEQNEEKAVRQFSRALNCNDSFWPARFYLGTLIQKSSPGKARQEFEMCRKSIAYYIENNSYAYRFLLEGFNAKYFLGMCRKWLKKLAHRE